MQNLYTILGVSPRANSAQIKAAYRSKAKLSHPDLHAGDKEAGKRIRKINYAYTILSKPRARTAYDRKLRVLRMRARRRWGAVAAAVVVSFTITVTTVSLMWRGEIGNPLLAEPQANLQPNFARDKSLIAETPEGHANTILAARRNEVAPSGEPTSIPANPRPGRTEIAAISPQNLQAGQPAVPSPSAQEAAPQTGSTGTDKLDQNGTQSVKVLSYPGESDSAGKSSPSDLAMSGDKSNMKRRDARDTNTNDVKISDLKLPKSKIPERARIAAKLQPTSRTNFEQASQENRNTCPGSQTCSRKEPPFFGVAF